MLSTFLVAQMSCHMSNCLAGSFNIGSAAVLRCHLIAVVVQALVPAGAIADMQFARIFLIWAGPAPITGAS